MADEVHKVIGVNPKLVAGSNGIFNVVIDGKLVFSKHETGRFPNPGEITNKLQK